MPDNNADLLANRYTGRTLPMNPARSGTWSTQIKTLRDFVLTQKREAAHNLISYMLGPASTGEQRVEI